MPLACSLLFNPASVPVNVASSWFLISSKEGKSPPDNSSLNSPVSGFIYWSNCPCRLDKASPAVKAAISSGLLEYSPALNPVWFGRNWFGLSGNLFK